jgi:hypothetical protein
LWNVTGDAQEMIMFGVGEPKRTGKRSHDLR